MLLSLKWLRELVPYQGTDQELGDRLTMLGLELEEVIKPFEEIESVVVGHVVECAKHPEADKLSVCRVDVGQGELLNIVCGAPNVAAGQKVAVAPVGCTLPGGLKLKKAKIRGVASQGMICAEDELGLGEDHTGIMVLNENLKVGTPIIEALNLDDVVFDIGVTPNRADCLSVLGLAREVGMAFNLPVSLPKFELKESGPNASELVRIEIPEPELCPVYQCRIIENVTVGSSPAWMRYRLLAIGQRPISNFVDVTNYVQFELGQPLHAFDMDLLEGDVIRVARAEQGMKFITLDNQERKLNDQDLLIWDGDKPVGLAGVMGGANTEIHDKSSRVLLEAAVFRPGSIRKTSRRLALPSEAAYRMERGLDHPGSLIALNRASMLMAELGGGTLLPGVAMAEPLPWKNRTLTFRPERARKLIGIPLETEFCETTIKGMGCKIKKLEDQAEETWEVEAPSHRLDLEREVDISEELARVHGMDRIPTVLPKVAVPLDDKDRGKNEYTFWMRLKNWARGAGLREAINYSFVGNKDLDVLGLPAEGRIPVMNPLSEDQDVLRLELAPGLLQNLRHNIAQGNDRLRLFEMAHTFIADPESDTTAREPGRMGLMLYGGRHDDAWPFVREDADYMDLKGLVEHLLSSLYLPKPEFAMGEEHPWLSPCVAVTVQGKPLGLLGRVRPGIAEQYHGRKPVWMADLDVDLLRALSEGLVPEFEDLPKFPPVRRDMTLATPDGVSVGAILEAMRSHKTSIMESVRMVDSFAPEDGGGERNLTFRLTFRHGQRTLKDKEVDKEVQKVANTVQKALPVKW